jgi:hypothetical protein
MKYKYTNYIVNGNVVDINSLIEKRGPVRIITIPLASTVAIMGFIVFACFIPMTVTVDSARQLKFQYIKTKRKYHVNYVFLIPIDQFDKVLAKLHIRLNIHDGIRRNEQFMKLGLLYVRNILLLRRTE